MPNKPHLLVASRMPDFVMEQLCNHFDVTMLADVAQPAEHVSRYGARYRCLASSAFGKTMGKDFFAYFPNLAIIANNGVGYDKIDVAAANELGIIVTNTPDVLTEEVADTALGLLINTVRQLPQAERHLREGRWKEQPYPLTDSLQGASLGIVGLGRIGLAIAKRAEAFGLKIAYHSRTAKEVAYPYYENLISLAKACTILMVATPGGADTHKMISADVLDALGPAGYLINIARGSVVDEGALIAALEAGAIAGAGLDVFANEPHVPERLLACKSAVLLPHVASASLRTRKAMGAVMVHNLLAYLADNPPLTPVPETPWRGTYRVR